MPEPDVIVPVACVQMNPEFGNADTNRATLDRLIGHAGQNGARIVVAPELCISGYAFRTPDEARALSEPADGPTAAAWTQIARRHGLYVVGGICERDGDALYNSAIVVDGDGPLGVYRKTHLWNDENRVFTPGNLGFPVFDTPLGKIGVLICYDLWFPEAYRACALKGADFVCVPTAWLPIPQQDAKRDAMHNLLAMTAAHVNSVPALCADRTGRERGHAFIGQSIIVGHTGWPVAGPASADGEETLSATLNVSLARRARRWSSFNDLHADRRPETYAG